MMHFLRYWMPVVVLCGAIFIQSAFPVPGVFPVFAWSDKLLHVSVYGLLGALFCRAFNAPGCWNGHWRKVWLAAVAAATLYGLSDEWHQYFVAERSAEWADVMADFAGSAVGGALFLIGLRHVDSRSARS